MSDKLLVRIKPYNPKRGHVTRRYTFAGLRFDEDRGWYEVERALADQLRDLHVHDDVDQPHVFDVCTRDEAVALEKREEAEKAVKSKADAPATPVQAQRRGARRGVPDSDPAAKSATPIVLDGADDGDMDDDADGRVASVGRLSDADDEDAPEGAPTKPARSRTRRG